MTTRLLEHVVRRAALAVQVSDLATGMPVTEGISVTAWSEEDPADRIRTTSVSSRGVAGFVHLPGLATYEDGSTGRDEWFGSPFVYPPRPFLVLVEDASGEHLPVIAAVMVPSSSPIQVAMPRRPSAPVPAGFLSVAAALATVAGAPAAWAAIQVAIGGYTTGGIADTRGEVIVPVPRAVAPDITGTSSTGPRWSVVVTVRYRPADQQRAVGAAGEDPPTLTSLLFQARAEIATGATFSATVSRSIDASGPLVLTSADPTRRSVLIVRPVP